MDKRKIIGIAGAILSVFAIALASYDAVRTLSTVSTLDIAVIAASIVLALGVVRMKKAEAAYATIMYLAALTIATINSPSNFAYMLNLGFFIVTTLWALKTLIGFARNKPIE